MPLQTLGAADALASLDSFHTVIDARSLGEYAEDHLPGAVNWPVLDDDQRREIGTEYKQVAPFDAKKRGAALVARNIAGLIERHVLSQPKGWRPLVYCWRGGKRSGTLAWFLSEIGFRTSVLEGGYKAARAAMVAQLEDLPARFAWQVVCGRTGSGKTRLLWALREAGAQVLDLEGLACHRGSVLGLLPDTPQPGQKAFETAIWSTLRRFDPTRPVFVESGSKKVGNLHVPTALIERMREHGRCLRIEMPDDARVQLLLEDYAFFRDDVELFCRQLDALVELRGRATVAGWQAAARQGRFAEVFLELMHRHYDPTYLRSIERNFKGYRCAAVVPVRDGDPHALGDLATRLLRSQAAQGRDMTAR